MGVGVWGKIFTTILLALVFTKAHQKDSKNGKPMDERFCEIGDAENARIC